MLSIAGDLAQENGLKIAIEPLNREETNILNSVPEALSYVQSLNHPAVGVLADCYHMYLEHQPVSDLSQAGKSLLHVHVSGADRRYPKSGDYDFEVLFGALRSYGYEDRVSVECAWSKDIVTEYEAALQFLRKFTTSALS
jgi:sugar phosphate isomerase/epimerase